MNIQAQLKRKFLVQTIAIVLLLSFALAVEIVISAMHLPFSVPGTDWNGTFTYATTDPGPATLLRVIVFILFAAWIVFHFSYKSSISKSGFEGNVKYQFEKMKMIRDMMITLGQQKQILAAEMMGTEPEDAALEKLKTDYKNAEHAHAAAQKSLDEFEKCETKTIIEYCFGTTAKRYVQALKKL